MKFTQILKVATSLAIITALAVVVIFLLWTIFKTGWDAYKILSDNVQVAIAAGLITLVTTAGSVMYTKIKERKLQIEANSNAHKQKLYSEFTGKILDLISDPSKGEDQEQMLEMRLNFMKNAFLWSDPKVLKAYQNFRLNSQLENEDGEQPLYDIAIMMLEFRKDLGLKNTNITPHTIMDILFDQNDLQSFYQKFPNKKRFYN